MNKLETRRRGRQITYAFFLLFLLAALVPILIELTRSKVNNYQIFKQVFFHTRSQENLFLLYPDLHSDSNHYGIFFSLVIAPFALMPDWLGIPLWTVLNSLALFFAVGSLNLTIGQKSVVWLVCLNDVVTSSFSAQINPLIAALIIFAFTSAIKGNEIKANFYIFFGALIKLYPVVGLAFVFLAKRRGRFILGSILCLAFLFFLPVCITSVEFLIRSYGDWFHALVEKNGENRRLYNQQDFSVMGIIRRVTGNIDIPDSPFLLVGALLYLLPFVLSKKADKRTIYYLLASSLIFPIIFSTSSESPTYVIAMVGVGIWYVNAQQKHRIWNGFLLALAVVFTSLAPTDLFPLWIRNEVFIRYSVKAFPCTLIWLSLSAELLFDLTRKLTVKQRVVSPGFNTHS